MYGDPEALYSCDQASIFPLCSDTSPENLFMEHYGTSNLNSSSGLLRFRSAPSSFLDSFSSNGNGYALNPAFYPTPSSTVTEPINGELEGGFRVPYPMRMGSPQLLRQNSSPTEFLSYPSGYAKMRAGSRYRLGNEAAEHIISPSGIQSSSLGMLSRISETESGGVESWNDPSIKFPEKYTDDIYSLFPGNQVGEPRNQASSFLSRQLSLPKTSAEIASMEKLFQYPDSAPLKIRAKRGCATHPRSIAERVRRTRISERMRKLQELVPNMDKQTNTAGMLDMAVDYIKDLQMQYKILSDAQANCKCSAGNHNLLPDRMF